MVRLTDISVAIEEFAPLCNQEEWDNCGWQIGPLSEEANSAMLCIDVTPEVIDEAIDNGCNLIVSHHPLIFRGISKITPNDYTSEIIIKAIQNGISIYSSHTAMDNVPQGVSGKMCEKLKLTNCSILEAQKHGIGSGMIGMTERPYKEKEFLEMVKNTFGAPVIKHTSLRGKEINKVAVCGGSGSFLIKEAKAQDADIFITADIKYHDFLGNYNNMLIADIGHFESEQFTKEIFYYIITKKFPKFAVRFSEMGKSPINTI